jgi:predicted Zn-dependent protease
VIERGLLVGGAAVAAVFGALWLHSGRLETKAQAIAERPVAALSRTDVDRAVRLFESARADNPDTRPAVLEAGLLIRAGRGRQALGLLKPVVGREPQNLTAWVLLAAAAQSLDPPLARVAAEHANALNPLAARAR